MTKGYRIKTEIFEGPLDLLLHLINKRKLHISDVSLAEITDDYMEYLGQMEEFPLADVAHFVLVASTLVLIKSRALLPSLSLTEEEEESIEDLELRLKQYQRMKALSEHVGERFGTARLFMRVPLIDKTPIFSPTHELTQKNILHAIQNILHTLPKKESIPQVVVQKMLTLEDVMDDLAVRMQKALSMSFKEFSKNAAGRTNTILGFLALLELVKRGSVKARQDGSFGDIMMEHA